MQTQSVITSARTLESHQNVIERAILAMHQNIDQSFSLEGMAKSAMCSPFHFNRVFRQRLGLTPSHFLGALRLQAAKRLLLTTSLSVIDVSFEAGYNSLGSFTTRFTQLVGIPPCRLRKLGSSFKDMDQLLEKIPIPASSQPVSKPSVTGNVTADHDFEGPIFVGLFREPIPQSAPVSCTVMHGCGHFYLPAAPDGEYFVFAAGQPWSEPVLSYLLSENILRGTSGPAPVHVKQGTPARHIEITLRRQHLTDPPILIAMPLLIGAQKG